MLEILFFKHNIFSYRFNGYDGRLDRELEAVVMVMESFEGFEQRVQCDIVGHSGETHQIQFVDHKNPPTNAKERLEVIKVKNCFKKQMKVNYFSEYFFL